MSSLRDEVYENLDYLSQLTEVVVGPQNLVLGRAPDRLDLTFNQLNRLKDYSWRNRTGFEIAIYKILADVLPKEDCEYIHDIKQHFKFEVSDDFELDFSNHKMTGTAALVKTVQQVEEKKMLEIAIDKACRCLGHYDWPNKRLREKAATVLNTFEAGRGTEWAKKLDGRASWSAHVEIKNTLSHVILENKWRIRDASIIIKVGQWINSYLSDEGDTSPGLVNLLKLKMMLNKDLPVYSVDEVKYANTARTP